MGSEKKAPVLTMGQFKAVVATAHTQGQGARNVALLFFSVALGLRAKELSKLLVRDVLSPDGLIKEEILLTRTTTKGGKQRLIYLSNREVRRAIRFYIQERMDKEGILNPKSALFLSRKGGGFSPNTMQMLFKRLYRQAGIEAASSHSGRRTFATSLIEKGVDIKAVSTLMGHSSIAMTARYVDDNPIKLKRVCEDINCGV